MTAETFTLILSGLASLVTVLLMVISFFLVRLVNSVDYIREAFTILKTEFTEHKKSDLAIENKVDEHAKTINEHAIELILIKKQIERK